MLNPLSSPRCLAIDTNLFLLLLGYQCLLLENASPLERNRVLYEIRGRSDRIYPKTFDDFWSLVSRAKRRIVTQHVVAETYGLRKRLAAFRQKKDLVWRSAAELLKSSPGIEEQPCKTQEMFENDAYRAILIELGPTDAGLILTAERQEATLITDDAQLASWAEARSVPVLRLNQIGAA